MTLLYVVQVGELGQDRPHQAEPIREREPVPQSGSEHEAAQLREDALARGLAHARRRLGGEPLRLGIGREAELGGEARQAQRTQRVVLVRRRAEHPQPAGLEIGAATQGIDELAAIPRTRHRVDREVALRQVGLDGLALERGEVVDAPALLIHHPPRAEGLRQPEHRRAQLCRQLARCLLGVSLHGDVDVRDLAAEQLVAERAADYPGAAHRTGSRRILGRRPVVTS